jgi:DNA-binding CsgD family transcriptional regulator
LHLGICSYSVSYSKGLEYANSALKAFEMLEKRNPEKALVGRSRCLQLISTIYTRQGKYREAIGLSKEAQLGFKPGKDSTGTLGLIYSSLGSAYQTLGKLDSTEYYYRKALEEQLLEKNETYLPTAYLKVAELEMTQGNSVESQQLQAKAREIAFRTGNRQAQVMVLLAEYKWQLEYEEIIQEIRDTLYTRDKDETVKRLEVEFEVSEKDREIRIIRQEKDIAQLTNSLLWVSVISLLVLALGVVGFQRKINRRNKQLLETRESLFKSEEEKKILKEKQLQNELEFKESQISAMALQMLQKNELMISLKDQLEKQGTSTLENDLNRILNRSDYQDKEWSDFNIQFESLNKNFYTRLKEAYPEISPNDLKLCALIKLNMSIKEMAGILNISPDSVKTARYRLRKKLKMNSEDNLTEFILAL